MNERVFSPGRSQHEIMGAQAAQRYYSLRFNLDGPGIRASANLLVRHWAALGGVARSEFAAGFLDAAYTLSVQRDRLLSAEVTS